MKCTISPQYLAQNADKIPVDTSSVWSREGVVQHDWNERLLRGRVTLDQIPVANRDYAEQWQNVIDDLESMYGRGERKVEAKVPLFYSPNETGTVDYAWITDSGIHVRDYKHGVGVLETPVENTQQTIYGLSLILELEESGLYSFDNELPVTLGIHQPRYRGEEPLRVWDTTVGELMNIGQLVSKAVAKINAEEGLEFYPSESTCKFCPAKGFCVARVDNSFSGFPSAINPLEVFGEIAHTDAKAISDEQLLSIFAKREQIIRLLKDIEEYLTERARGGKALPGTKLVWGREGNRAWVSEEVVVRALKNRGVATSDIYERKLASPAKIFALPAVKEGMTMTRFKNIMDAAVVRPRAKATLTTEEDERPAIVTAVFSDISGDAPEPREED